MAAPTNVLRVITRMNIGGPAIHAALLSNGLDSERFSTRLVTGRPDPNEGDLSDLLQRERVKVIRLNSFMRPLHPWRDLVTLARLVRIAWRERPRILHTHMAKAGALGRLAGIAYNRWGPGRGPGQRAVIIHTFHGHVLSGYFPVLVSRLFVIIERWLARRSDCLIAVSERIRAALLERKIGTPDQWRVIPLGLDLSDLASLPPPPERPPMFRIGLVGRLVPIKNPGLFLAALQRVRELLPQAGVRGLVVGDGPLRRQLEAEAQAMGFDGYVEFTGWRRDLRACYEGLDAVCLTSWNEGTPAALIEAMAAGRAVLATDVGGVRDVLGETARGPAALSPGTFHVTERGILVQPGDAEGLAKAMATLAGDAQLRRRMGEAARAYVVERFTQERLVRDMTALYEELLQRSVRR